MRHRIRPRWRALEIRGFPCGFADLIITSSSLLIWTPLWKTVKWKNCTILLRLWCKVCCILLVFLPSSGRTPKYMWFAFKTIWYTRLLEKRCTNLGLAFALTCHTYVSLAATSLVHVSSRNAALNLTYTLARVSFLATEPLINISRV